MKNRLPWLAVMLLVLMFALAHAQAPTRADSQVGRFQIVASPSDSTFGVRVYRIDTVTGKTWTEALVLEGGKKRTAWAEIPDYAHK